jgi:exodeoxyribonuclease VII small subunit
MQGTDACLNFESWERISRDGSFEESLEALQEVVAILETGNHRLDDSVRCYELGTLLARHCERLLNDAELRISRLDEESDEVDIQLELLNG